MISQRFFSIFGNVYTVTTNIASVDKHLCAVYEKFLQLDPDRPLVEFELLKNLNSYSFSINGRRWGEYDNVITPLWLLDHQLMKFSIEDSRRHLIFHGAWATTDKVAYVLLGNGGAGKSTLCYELMAHGWYCGSDECVAFDTVSGMLTPFPRKIMIKADNDYMQQYRLAEVAENMLVNFDGRIYIDDNKYLAVKHNERFKLKYIWLDYQPSAAWKVNELDTLLSLQAILGFCFNRKNINATLFQQFVEDFSLGSLAHVIYARPKQLTDYLLNGVSCYV